MVVPRASYLPLILTVVVAGFGHLYLGYWRRGLLWLGMYLLSLVFLSAYAPTILGGDSTAPFLFSVLEGRLSPAGAVFPLSVLALCLIDVSVLRWVGNAEGKGETQN